MDNKEDYVQRVSYITAEIVEDNLDDPRYAVLQISKIYLPSGDKIGILNAEIIYEKSVMYALRHEKKKYRFNNSGFIKRCNRLIKRSQTKKKKKKKKK
jgi:hypothetical protein